MKHLAAHDPREVDWEQLPESCAFQTHWHRAREVEALLRSAGFRAATLARHPLDVLVSILHFARREPTARWLEREGGDEESIHGVKPTSRAFLEYATSSRAQALLSVTTEWWSARGSSDSLRGSGRRSGRTGGPALLLSGTRSCCRCRGAVEAAGIEELRPLVTNEHFRQGASALEAASPRRFFTCHHESSRGRLSGARLCLRRR